MSRYAARLRSLEHRIVPACPLCAGYPAIDFITVHGDETPPPPPPPCEACGKQPTKFVVHHAADEVELSTRVEKGSAADTVARSQQTAAGLPPRVPSAENVLPTEDVKPRSQRHSKALIRRRRYYGPT